MHRMPQCRGEQSWDEYFIHPLDILAAYLTLIVPLKNREMAVPYLAYHFTFITCSRVDEDSSPLRLLDTETRRLVTTEDLRKETIETPNQTDNVSIPLSGKLAGHRIYLKALTVKSNEFAVVRWTSQVEYKTARQMLHFHPWIMAHKNVELL